MEMDQGFFRSVWVVHHPLTGTTGISIHLDRGYPETNALQVMCPQSGTLPFGEVGGWILGPGRYQFNLVTKCVDKRHVPCCSIFFNPKDVLGGWVFPRKLSRIWTSRTLTVLLSPSWWTVKKPQSHRRARISRDNALWTALWKLLSHRLSHDNAHWTLALLCKSTLLGWKCRFHPEPGCRCTIEFCSQKGLTS